MHRSGHSRLQSAAASVPVAFVALLLMPFTPFHFGPAALAHAIAPRSVSFLAFVTTNILIDAEVAVNLATKHDRLHTFFHTYLGATLIIVITITAFIIARTLARKFLPPHLQEHTHLSTTSIILGSLIGAYSHILLDSFMHQDMEPFAPFSSQNPLLGMIPLAPLHLTCILAGISGITILVLRALATKRSAAT